LGQRPRKKVISIDSGNPRQVFRRAFAKYVWWQEQTVQGVLIVSQIDLDGSSFRELNAAGAREARQPAVTAGWSPQENPREEKGRSWIGRAVESTIYGILIIPFAVVVCAVVAFAILPLHSDSRCDDGYE